jgi:hypothetical protein
VEHDSHKTERLEFWELAELEEALLLIGNDTKVDVNVCLFVDALDEHGGNHKNLLSILIKLRDRTANDHFKLRLCVAGRPENLFKDAFRSYPGFAIQVYTASDIQKYARGRLRTELEGSGSRSAQAKFNVLIAEVVSRAEGVFLWVRLVIDEIVEGICEGDTIDELKELLSTIPSELEKLYTRALHRTRRTSTRTLPKHRYETCHVPACNSCI